MASLIGPAFIFLGLFLALVCIVVLHRNSPTRLAARHMRQLEQKLEERTRQFN